jgi:hypothetical protein
MKILILEDDINSFKSISEFIGEEFGNDVEIFPSSSKKNIFIDSSFDSDFEHINENIQDSFSKKEINVFFDEIISKYLDVNIYIVDINLIPLNKDRLGITFLEYINNASILTEDKHSFIISVDTVAGTISLKDNQYDFLTKYNNILNIKKELLYRLKRFQKNIKK